ncbi:MAG: hypothetical protein V1867_07640 [Candidatus Falkowbacteria bacterium]
METTKKIAVACFIGGVICCGTALVFSPAYWWLGLFAGFAGGYLSYEFREIFRAVPHALRAASVASREYAHLRKEEFFASIKAWFRRPHPFLYTGLIVMLPVAFWLFPILWEEVNGMPEPLLTKVVIICVFSFGICFVSVMAVIIPFWLLAAIGAESKGVYWRKCYHEPFRWVTGNGQEVPATFANAVEWAIRGIFVIIKFFVWTLWKRLVIAVYRALCYTGRFFWYLFKLVHSEKRILCALDGTIGGAVSYIWFASVAATPVEQMVFIIFGGLLGAALGVINWEIVSKRILHVPVTK